MSSPIILSTGTFSRGKVTASQGTPIAQYVPPRRIGTGKRDKGVIHVTSLIYNIGTTAHTLTVMRPLNYATFAADAAAAQATVVLNADPGVYSAGGYKYGLDNGVTAPRTANNAIAANDYVVYQTADGGYVMDVVSSGTYAALVLTNNLPTGGVLAGGLLWFFGISTDKNPYNDEAHQPFTLAAAASGTADNVYSDPSGLWNAFHPGDPMIFYSDNSTAAGIISLIAGYYDER